MALESRAQAGEETTNRERLETMAKARGDRNETKNKTKNETKNKRPELWLGVRQRLGPTSKPWPRLQPSCTNSHNETKNETNATKLRLKRGRKNETHTETKNETKRRPELWLGLRQRPGPTLKLWQGMRNATKQQ